MEADINVMAFDIVNELTAEKPAKKAGKKAAKKVIPAIIQNYQVCARTLLMTPLAY